MERKKGLMFFLIVKDCQNRFELFTKKTSEYVNVAKRPMRYDLVICLDCNNISRLGKFQEVFDKAKNSINIDHHHDNTNFANLNIVVPNLPQPAK